MGPRNSSAILASLTGQSLVLRDLNVLFSHWPRKINPNLDELRQDVDLWLEKYDDILCCTDTRVLVLTGCVQHYGY